MESPSPGVSVISESHPITVEEWQHRFKVVKIASKEPRKRGRWYCMDFNDPPPTSSNVVQEPNLPTTKTPESFSHTQSITTGTSPSTLTSNNQTANVVQENKNSSSQQFSETPVVDEKTFDHLMFAVREEVVVLKERINELMSKISKLELENSILKAHAAPETLSLLQNNQTNHPNQPEQINIQNQVQQVNPIVQHQLQAQSQPLLQENVNPILTNQGNPKQD